MKKKYELPELELVSLQIVLTNDQETIGGEAIEESTGSLSANTQTDSSVEIETGGQYANP